MNQQPAKKGKTEGPAKQEGVKEKRIDQPKDEHNVAHTPASRVPDPDAPRVGKEVLTEEDARKAS